MEILTMERLVEFTKGMVKTIIEEKGQQHEPMLLVEGDGGVTPVVLADIPKEYWGGVTMDLLKKTNAIGYVFICETWTTDSEINPESAKRVIDGELKVSELPPDDRKDCVMVLSQEKGRSKMWMSEVDEIPGGRKMGEWKEMVDGEEECRLTNNILPEVW